jgi:integrase
MPIPAENDTSTLLRQPSEGPVPAHVSSDLATILREEPSAEMRQRLVKLAPTVLAEVNKHPLLDAVQKRLRAENKTPRTVETYLSVLRQGIAAGDLLYPLRAATSDARYNVVHSILKFVDGRVRAWQKEAERQGLRIDLDVDFGIRVVGILDQAADIPKPNRHGEPVVAPNVDEWKHVVAAAKTLASPLREIMLVLLRTGLRVSDVLMISRTRMEDIHVGQAVVLQKGKKPRVWKMHRLVEDDIRKLLRVRGWETIEEIVYKLYRQECGKTIAEDRRMAVYHYLRRVLDRICKEARVRPFSPHKFRHALGTYLHDSGLGMRGVQQSLGHAEIETTQHYVHDVEDGDIERAYDKVMQKIEGDV